MLKLASVLSLIIFTAARSGFYLDNQTVELTSQDIRCFNAESITFFFVPAIDSNGPIKNFTTTYTALKKANTTDVDIVVAVCGDQAAKDFAKEVAGVIPAGWNNTIWLELIANPSKSCWLNPISKAAFLVILENIVKNLRSYGYNQIGIKTDYDSWQSYMKTSVKKHSDLLTGLPLCYFAWDGDLSFSDYNATTQIGDWTKPSAKELALGAYLVCGDMYPPYIYKPDDTKLREDILN